MSEAGKWFGEACHFRGRQLERKYARVQASEIAMQSVRLPCPVVAVESAKSYQVSEGLPERWQECLSERSMQALAVGQGPAPADHAVKGHGDSDK